MRISNPVLHVCLWCGRYEVQILSRSNLPHVANDSPPLLPRSVVPDAKPRRWASLTRDIGKGIKGRVQCFSIQVLINKMYISNSGQHWTGQMALVVRRWWWWWCYPTPSEGWGRGGTLRRLKSRATPQGLDQRSKMEEVVPKMARRRGTDAGQSRRR